MVENIITNLTNKEIAVIKAVDELGNASVIQIAQKADIKRTTIYNFVDKLVDSGLLGVKIVNGAKRYYEPNKNLSLIETEKTGETKKANRSCVLVNIQAIKREINKTLKEEKVDFIFALPEINDLLGELFIRKYVHKATKKEANFRIMWSLPNISDKKNINHQKLMTYGRILNKTNHNLFIKSSLIVTKGYTIFVSPTEGGVGYKINDSALSASIKLMFDSFWYNAREI